jgi:transposase
MPGIAVIAAMIAGVKNARTPTLGSRRRCAGRTESILYDPSSPCAAPKLAYPAVCNTILGCHCAGKLEQTPVS